MSMVGEAPRRRRWPIVLIIVLGVLAILVAAFFIVDSIARGAAEDRIRAEVVDNIPGASTDQVQVSIGGASVILQYLSGTLDDIQVSGSDLEVGGVPVTFHVNGAGVPVDQDLPIALVKGTVSLNAAAVNELVHKSGQEGTVALGDGTVSYDVQRKLLGIPLTFSVDAKPSPTGSGIAFAPTDAHVAAGSVSFDVSGLVGDIVSSEGFTVCLADSLPAGSEVTGVGVTPEHLTIDLQAKDLVLADAGKTGSC